MSDWATVAVKLAQALAEVVPAATDAYMELRRAKELQRPPDWRMVEQQVDRAMASTQRVQEAAEVRKRRRGDG